MSGGKGTSYKTSVLNYLLTTNAVTRPTSWTIALYSDANSVTEITTSNAPGYSRQNATFSTASNGSTSNSNDIAFTATGAWVQVSSYAILDQSGNQVYVAPLSTARTLQVSGDKLDFAIGSITVSES